MRIGPPGFLQHARRLTQFPAFGEHAAGERGRRHQSRRKLCGFESKSLGVIAVGFLRGHRPRRQQHRALPAIGLLVERALAAFQQRQRAGPITRGAAEFEHCLARPAKRWIIPRRFLGKRMRADMIGAPLCLNEETVEAERLGIGAACHGSKGNISRFTIAGELRRLRAEQERERFGRRNTFYFRGVLARGSKVAGADGDQAAGNRLIGALATATVQMPPEDEWRSENRTQQGPNERQHRHRRPGSLRSPPSAKFRCASPAK